jgi:hypothetical protein
MGPILAIPAFLPIVSIAEFHYFGDSPIASIGKDKLAVAIRTYWRELL